MEEYKKLDVYRLAHELATEIHAVSLKLPKHELYEEGGQIRRSSKAIPANIVEGYGRRRYQQEYVRYLVFAHASCEETLEHLDLIHDTGSLKDELEYQRIRAGLDTLARKLNRLIQTISIDIHTHRPEPKAHGLSPTAHNA